MRGHGFNSGRVAHIDVPPSPSSIIWYWPKGGDALSLAESNASLPLGLWLSHLQADCLETDRLPTGPGANIKERKGRGREQREGWFGQSLTWPICGAMWLLGRWLPLCSQQARRRSNGVQQRRVRCVSSCEVSSDVDGSSELSGVPPVHRREDRHSQRVRCSAGRHVWGRHPPLSRDWQQCQNAN